MSHSTYKLLSWNQIVFINVNVYLKSYKHTRISICNLKVTWINVYKNVELPKYNIL